MAEPEYDVFEQLQWYDDPHVQAQRIAFEEESDWVQDMLDQQYLDRLNDLIMRNHDAMIREFKERFSH